MPRYTISVNDRSTDVDAAEDTPLLYILSNALGLKGPRLGCGLAQCGSCSVLINGIETRACVTPISDLGGRSVVTLEGLAASYAREKKLARVPEVHPLQQAFIDEHAPQCGYCYNGMTIKGAELLSRNSRSKRGRHSSGDEWPSLSVRHLSEDYQSRAACRAHYS